MRKEELLELKNLTNLRTRLRQVDPYEEIPLILDNDVFAHLARLCNAFWMHQGSPREPHAILTSGLHSNGFISNPEIVQYPALCQFLARQLVLRLREHYLGPVDCVVGSSYAAITFSYAVAAVLGARHIFTEKEGDQQLLKRFSLRPGELLLRAEDLITTSGTTRSVTEAVRAQNPRILPFVLTIVNRGEADDVDGDSIIHGARFRIRNYPAGDCLLCRNGSEAIRPRATPENWARLTAQTT